MTERTDEPKPLDLDEATEVVITAIEYLMSTVGESSWEGDGSSFTNGPWKLTLNGDRIFLSWKGQYILGGLATGGLTNVLRDLFNEVAILVGRWTAVEVKRVLTFRGIYPLDTDEPKA